MELEGQKFMEDNPKIDEWLENLKKLRFNRWDNPLRNNEERVLLKEINFDAHGNVTPRRVTYVEGDKNNYGNIHTHRDNMFQVFTTALQK